MFTYHSNIQQSECHSHYYSSIFPTTKTLASSGVLFGDSFSVSYQIVLNCVLFLQMPCLSLLVRWSFMHTSVPFSFFPCFNTVYFRFTGCWYQTSFARKEGGRSQYYLHPKKSNTPPVAVLSSSSSHWVFSSLSAFNLCVFDWDLIFSLGITRLGLGGIGFFISQYCFFHIVR